MDFRILKNPKIPKCSLDKVHSILNSRCYLVSKMLNTFLNLMFFFRLALTMSDVTTSSIKIWGKQLAYTAYIFIFSVFRVINFHLRKLGMTTYKFISCFLRPWVHVCIYSISKVVRWSKLELKSLHYFLWIPQRVWCRLYHVAVYFPKKVI